jgi:hypothetical protein
VGVGRPRKTPEEMEPTWVEAYELRCDGLSFREIAAQMAGPPHYCGGHPTAIRWWEQGRAIVAAKGDKSRSRRARREMAIDALDKLRVKMDLDLKAGTLDGRVDYYKLQRQYILDAATLAGAQAAREPARVHVTGNGRPRVTPELLAPLAALAASGELDELIDSLQPLPDDETRER